MKKVIHARQSHRSYLLQQKVLTPELSSQTQWSHLWFCLLYACTRCRPECYKRHFVILVEKKTFWDRKNTIRNWYIWACKRKITFARIEFKWLNCERTQRQSSPWRLQLSRCFLFFFLGGGPQQWQRQCGSHRPLRFQPAAQKVKDCSCAYNFIVGKPLTSYSAAMCVYLVASTLATLIWEFCKARYTWWYTGCSRLQCPHHGA